VFQGERTRTQTSAASIRSRIRSPEKGRSRAAASEAGDSTERCSFQENVDIAFRKWTKPEQVPDKSPTLRRAHHVPWAHPVGSSGTSPNVARTTASSNSPMSGSPVRENARLRNRASARLVTRLVSAAPSEPRRRERPEDAWRPLDPCRLSYNRKSGQCSVGRCAIATVCPPTPHPQSSDERRRIRPQDPSRHRASNEPYPAASLGFWATLGWTLLSYFCGAIAWVGVAVWTGSTQSNPLSEPLSIAEGDCEGSAGDRRAGARRKIRALAGRGVSGVGSLGERDVVLGIQCLVAVLILTDGLIYLSGGDVVTPFQIGVYRAARAGGTLPWMWLAFVVAAPAMEEVTFRGFVYRGWAASRVGPLGAILLTSLAWSMMHLQYDWRGIVQIFAFGLLFGWCAGAAGP